VATGGAEAFLHLSGLQPLFFKGLKLLKK